MPLLPRPNRSVILVPLRLSGNAGPTLVSLAHALTAIHPAIPVQVGATRAAFAMALLAMRHAPMLALLMLAMVGRLAGWSGLREGRRGDRQSERGGDDLHVGSP